MARGNGTDAGAPSPGAPTAGEAAPPGRRPRAAARGFASMDATRQRDIARKGGKSVPAEKRSFSQDRGLAAQAGRKGGESVSPSNRSFSKNRALAAAAGRKGGQATGGGAAGPDDADGAGADRPPAAAE